MPRYTKQIKYEAIKLRKKGYSIREISKALFIAKSTASLWVKNIKLESNAQTRLLYRQNMGVKKGISTRQQRLAIIYDAIQNIVEFDITKLKLEILNKRLLCAFLYWGEGAKTGRQVRIINSDPKLIQIFLKLFRESFLLDENKFSATLHLHEYHNRNLQLQFWSKITKIPKNRIGIYLKSNSGVRKKIDYPGCIAVHYYDAKIFDILTAYYKKFSERLGA